MTKISKSVIVLGGGYAGVLAAIRLAGHAGKVEKPWQVRLISDSPFFVERIRLHEAIFSSRRVEHSLQDLLRHTGVELSIDRITQIDAPNNRLLGDQVWHYDHLLIATGSSVDCSIDGAEHAHFLRSPAHAKALGDALARLPRCALVRVVGGGLTAIETATEIAARHPHLRVSILHDSPLEISLSTEGAEKLSHCLKRLGIQTIGRQRVVRVLPNELQTWSGEVFSADLVVWTAGMKANGLPSLSNLPVDGQQRLTIDNNLRVLGHPNIYAAGDIAFPSDPSMQHFRMSCALAMPMGAHSADNIARDLENQERVPFSFGYAARCVSLGRHDGLLQFVDAKDRPKPRAWSGRVVAFIKECICRYTYFSLKLEALFPGIYSWPKAPKMPSLLADNRSRESAAP